MSQKETLNVVLHGFHVVSKAKDGKSMQAVAPRIKGHVYLAGAWLDEKVISDQASYEVDVPNWTPPTTAPTFDPKFLRVETPTTGIANKYVHHVVHLPMPSKIHAQAFSQLKNDHFESRTGGVTTSGDHLSSVLVLVYDKVSDLNQVRFGRQGDPSRKPLEVFELDDNKLFSNLHLWADNDGPESVSEAAQNARDVYVPMLNANRYPVFFPEVRTIGDVDGLTEGEYSSLPARHKRFRNQLNLWRTEKASRDKYPGSALMRPSTIGSINDSPTCGFCFGGDY